MTLADRALLDAYARHATEPTSRRGARDRALSAASGLSATRAHQRLVWLLDDPQAWAYAPSTLGLIRRRLDSARVARSARRVA